MNGTYCSCLPAAQGPGPCRRPGPSRPATGLGAELAPAEGQLAEYDWLVSVVRVNPTGEGQLALEAASPPSEIRRFTWR